MGGAGGGLGEGGEGLAELADVLGFPGFSLLEFPHAESDTTVTPATARIASRVNRCCRDVALISVLRSQRCARGTRRTADLHNY